MGKLKIDLCSICCLVGRHLFEILFGRYSCSSSSFYWICLSIGLWRMVGFYLVWNHSKLLFHCSAILWTYLQQVMPNVLVMRWSQLIILYTMHKCLPCFSSFRICVFLWFGLHFSNHEWVKNLFVIRLDSLARKASLLLYA